MLGGIGQKLLAAELPPHKLLAGSAKGRKMERRLTRSTPTECICTSMILLPKGCHPDHPLSRVNQAVHHLSEITPGRPGELPAHQSW